MTRFSTDDLPRPVVTLPLSHESAYQRRLGEYVDLAHAAGNEYDVVMLESDPAVIGAQAAAYGDMYFVSALNDAARVILLPSFAEGSDLDLQATRAGLERLDGETDAALRERMRLSWKGKSAAGPDDYYKSAARNYSALVKDVQVAAETRNFSNRVLILSVLTTDNDGLLSAGLQAELTDVLNKPSFRSRNVTIEVSPAVITTRDVSADIFLYPDAPDSVVPQAANALTEAYQSDQKMGFDVTSSYLQRHLHRPGVQRVELQGWTDAFAAFNEAIRLGTITLTPFRVAS